MGVAGTELVLLGLYMAVTVSSMYIGYRWGKHDGWRAGNRAGMIEGIHKGRLMARDCTNRNKTG